MISELDWKALIGHVFGYLNAGQLVDQLKVGWIQQLSVSKQLDGQQSCQELNRVH